MSLAKLDHLVVMAASLSEGVAWCEATLGVTPGPGGEHPLMGTHNRLLAIASPQFPSAYLEIIAINPVAARAIATGARRWFDMDNAALRERVARSGPQLTHWVAQVNDVHAGVAALAAQSIDRGQVLQASRKTAGGVLQWHITVRPDGQRLFDGCLPTLIQWVSAHPTAAMPACGVTLRHLQLQHPEADTLNAALHAVGMPPLAGPGSAALSVQLQTPKGLVELHTWATPLRSFAGGHATVAPMTISSE